MCFTFILLVLKNQIKENQESILYYVDYGLRFLTESCTWLDITARETVLFFCHHILITGAVVIVKAGFFTKTDALLEICEMK